MLGVGLTLVLFSAWGCYAQVLAVEQGRGLYMRGESVFLIIRRRMLLYGEKIPIVF